MPDVSVREARPSDLPQIHEIFAHYAENTVATFYFHNPPLATIQSKYETATTRGLPHLVALSSASESTSGTPTDVKILGYAYASPFRAPLLAYTSSVEVSIFVHPSHIAGGIGGQLMTAPLDRLKTAVHHGVEPGHEGEGRDAAIKNAFAVMAHDVNGPGNEAGVKLQAWYERFGFEVMGRLINSGWKFDRWCDTIYLQLSMETWKESRS